LSRAGCGAALTWQENESQDKKASNPGAPTSFNPEARAGVKANHRFRAD